jgi:hypothetical protein
MGRDAASRRIDPVSRWQCAPRATSSYERRHRSLALTRSRVSPHNRALGAVVVLAAGERPQPRLKTSDGATRGRGVDGITVATLRTPPFVMPRVGRTAGM